MFTKKTHRGMFLVALFVITKNPETGQQMYRLWHTYMRAHSSATNRDEFLKRTTQNQNHYVSDKSITQDNLLSDPIYMEF